MQHFLQQHELCLYAFLAFAGLLAGFVDAVAGGGGLISVPALAVTGMPIALALGTNKLQSSIGTSVAVYNYYRDGLINFKTVYRGLIMGLIGACLGAILANLISNQFMRYIVPFLMLSVYVFNLINKSLGIAAGKQRMDERGFFAIFGFIFGFYDAFFGPGVGNFWIMAIVFFLGYTFINASGYAKVLNLKSNLFALMIFIYFGQVNYLFGLVMAVGQFFGGYFGARMVIVNGSKLVRPFFMTVVFINLIILFYQLIFAQPSVTIG